MSWRRLLIIIIILLLLPFSLPVKAQDFGRSMSLFTDIKASAVGDILTVLIIENSRASTTVEEKTEKTQDASTSGGPGIGTLSFFPMFGADAKSTSNHDGKGENRRQGTVRAQMTVTVVDVRNNGDLVIEGTRIVNVSGNRETITLTGIVRQKDVSADNTVESFRIGDAEISYTGKGNLQTASRPGIFMRLLNWLF